MIAAPIITSSNADFSFFVPFPFYWLMIAMVACGGTIFFGRFLYKQMQSRYHTKEMYSV